MPIRIVPRFCARGCGRFEKLLYGCRNPLRWDRADVAAKISILRLNIGSRMLRPRSCMLRLGLSLSIGSSAAPSEAELEPESQPEPEPKLEHA